MSSAFPRERKKQETNLGPWSEVTCSGTPCLENKCIMNSIARSLEVQWMVVRMNMPCLESRSSITRIESQPEDVRRVSMKYIEMEFHGRSGFGSHTSCTMFTIFLHKFTESGPGIIAADEVHCLILTRMSREDVVMLVAEIGRAHV